MAWNWRKFRVAGTGRCTPIPSRCGTRSPTSKHATSWPNNRPPASRRRAGIASGHVAAMDDRSPPPGPTSYSLKLSDQELLRYHLMAASAADHEAAEWSAAGIVPGARVADVGCGPGAVLRLLAERVGADGQAAGVDADPSAVAMARQQTADLPQARVQAGRADATGLEPGAWDVVMCRHVLAHNGGREALIVAHLASLAASGGCVYLVDTDTLALRYTTGEPELEGLQQRYRDFHRAKGNDLSVGM